MAEADGEDVRVSARGVIVASGGYANNKEWIKKFSGFEMGINAIPIGNFGKTGDGIKMAFEVGAEEEGLGLLELYRVGPLGPGFSPAGQIEYAATQPDLWVNPRGERFCDETVAFFDTSVGNANARFKEGYTYSIFDDSVMAYHRKGGQRMSL
jgi:fumarate reductase flavoprotein subunit